MGKKTAPPDRSSSPVAAILGSASRGKSKKKSKKEKETPVEPVVDDDDVEEVEEEVEEESGDATGVDTSITISIRDSISKLFKEKGSMPSISEIADDVGESEETVLKARKALALARQGQRLKVHRNAAKKAGAVDREGASFGEFLGQTLTQTILSESDVQRMVRSIPVDHSKNSYSLEEARARISLMHESLPKNSARLLIGFLEPIFRSLLKEGVEVTATNKRVMLNAATMDSILSRFRPYMYLSGTEPAAGLIRAAMEDGVEPLDKRDAESPPLMAVSDEMKKQFVKDKKMNAEIAAFEKKVIAREVERVAMKKRKLAEEKLEQTKQSKVGA